MASVGLGARDVEGRIPPRLSQSVGNVHAQVQMPCDFRLVAEGRGQAHLKRMGGLRCGVAISWIEEGATKGILS